VNDQVVSGAYDGDAGVLVTDPQLAVFEAVHGRSDGGLDHLALHDTILKDTRIVPLGFVPDEDTGAGGHRLPARAGRRLARGGGVDLPGALPRGAALARGTGYGRGPPLPPGHDARVRRGARAANLTDGTGDLLRSIWESTGRARPVLMTSASVLRPLTQASGVTGSCACQATGGVPALVPGGSVLRLGVVSRAGASASSGR
jgi:hypothetical protein